MGRVSGALINQRPGDAVTIAFLLFLLGLTIVFYPSLPRGLFLLSLYTSLIFVQIGAIKLKNKGGFLRFFHDLIVPTICILAIFDSLEWVVHYVNPEDIDPVLIRLDYMIFGAHPTVALEKIMHPVLTDILQIAYTTYYFIPISFGVVLLMKKQRSDFEKSLFMILLCFYLSYLGYILFPALGPRFYLDHLQTIELRGFLVAEPIQELLNRLEGIKRDAFPSGHTAVTLIVLYLAYGVHRRFFWIALPFVTGLLFSTVYCRYHYVVDVLAGFVLTIITILLGEWYYRWWLRRRDAKKEIQPG
jgi:membrane-associated phospholipid phosphatase